MGIFDDVIKRPLKRIVDQNKKFYKDPSLDTYWGATESILDPWQLFFGKDAKIKPPTNGLVGPSRDQTVMNVLLRDLEELRKRNGQGSVLGGDMLAETNAPTASQQLFGGMEQDNLKNPAQRLFL